MSGLSWWSWWPWHRFSLWGAKRQGRLDGEKNIPDWQDPDQPPYVLEVVEAAEHDIRRLIEEWHERDREYSKGKRSKPENSRRKLSDGKRKPRMSLKKLRTLTKKLMKAMTHQQEPILVFWGIGY